MNKDASLSLRDQLRWWLYYHIRTAKGRYEVYHFLEWLLCMAACMAALEGILYLCIG